MVVDWIYVAQDKDRSRVLLNTAMNEWIFVFHKMQEIPEQAEGLSFMQSESQ